MPAADFLIAVDDFRRIAFAAAYTATDIIDG